MTKIIGANSRADNRSDEAAQRAMISGIAALIPDLKSTVLLSLKNIEIL